ncbi:MAG: hypothetical protein R6V85_19690 [Polyangia bacterium]
MADVKTNLELDLEEIAAGLASEVAGIIRGLTVDELLNLISDREQRSSRLPGERATAPRKKRIPGKKAAQRKKTEKEAATLAEPVKEPEPEKPAQPEPEAAAPTPEPEPEAAAPTPEPEPEAAAPAPAPKPRPTVVSSYRRAERERLEEAVVDFVSRNPGTDAEPVSARLGLPKGRAQTVLDDLVLRGTLSMTSGQHGRCYSVAGPGQQ